MVVGWVFVCSSDQWPYIFLGLGLGLGLEGLDQVHVDVQVQVQVNIQAIAVNMTVEPAWPRFNMKCQVQIVNKSLI